MLNELQSFLKTPLGAALVDRFLHQGSEDLKQAFAVGNEMAHLLREAHKYIEKINPKDAAEFARDAERAERRYREHVARYLEIRGSWKT